MRMDVKRGLEHVARLHGRLHNLLGRYADEVIQEIQETSVRANKPYIEVLEFIVKQALNNEIPRQKGAGNRASKRARNGVGHPWTQACKGGLR